MNYHYRDIRDRLGPPLWWDEVAVPRYITFSPHEVHNIYAEEVALVLISCQSCGREFKVAMSSSSFDTHKLTEDVEADPPSLWYSDPPNVLCCPAGPTMTSITHRVLQFWRLDRSSYQWERIEELERDLYDPVYWESMPHD